MVGKSSEPAQRSSFAGAILQAAFESQERERHQGTNDDRPTEPPRRNEF